MFLESISVDGQLAIGLEATEGFLGLQQAGGGPSKRHLGVSPAFDVAGDLAHRAERVLYDVGAGVFIVDGAKALSKAIRNTFGVAAAIQRCQVHKGRNIIERLPQHLHASVKKALRQAWDQDDANKAERLLRNLVRRLEHEEPGVSGSILEGLDEILTVIRLGLPHELRRSLACTNIVENALGTVRQVTRNVKRWRHAEMALRWTAAGLLEAQKTFRRLKAYRQLPILRNALQEHLRKAQADSAIETIMKAA